MFYQLIFQHTLTTFFSSLFSVSVFFLLTQSFPYFKLCSHLYSDLSLFSTVLLFLSLFGLHSHSCLQVKRQPHPDVGPLKVGPVIYFYHPSMKLHIYLCIACRGKQCSNELRCGYCRSWSSDELAKVQAYNDKLAMQH